MPVKIETFVLSDERRTEILLGGDPAGMPLVMHHGTPSDATIWSSWSDICAERGLWLVASSRPGYGGSDRQPGRSVADAARATSVLLDRLGSADFVTLGWSGGGPHALACAALLGPRCRGAAILAGVGPCRMAGVDFLAGMGPENVSEFGAAFAGEGQLRAWMEAHAAPFRTVSGEMLGHALGGLVPPIDRDELGRGYGDELAAVMRRALAPGFDGWIDDDLAFTRDWGFALDAIAAPVTLWQGDLDLMVPPSHGQWLAANIPGARFEFAAGHGHISLLTQGRAEILNALSGARR